MRTCRAFSLVEVLIAIVVLALGLLGLAAVFPAVLSQQRRATDTVMSTSTQNAVTHYLLENRVLNRPSRPNINGLVPPQNERGWQLLTANTAWSPPVNFNQAQRGGDPDLLSGDWAAVSGNPATVGMSIDPATGSMRIIGVSGLTPPDPNFDQPWFDVPLPQRLSPTPYDTTSQPQYVWDFVARRVASGSAPTSIADVSGLGDDSVQLAVFIRHIDTGIRRPPGRVLADVLTGTNVSNADRRVPVASDTTGRPTFDGMGDTTQHYSTLQSIEYGFFGADETATPPRYDRLVLDPSGTIAGLSPFAKQIGQKFVDSWGVVHTVVGLDSDPADTLHRVRAVLVQPPIDHARFDNWTNFVSPTHNFVFVPQVPTSVFVLTIRVPAPSLN